jgi:hypothetical protein
MNPSRTRPKLRSVASGREPSRRLGNGGRSTRDGMVRQSARHATHSHAFNRRATHARPLGPMPNASRSLAENGRRGDPRPRAGSGRRAVGIQGPRSSRLLDCSTSLHRGGRNPGKHRSADAPHSQLQWSVLGARRGASRFALSRRANPPPAPELRTDRVQALFCPCSSVAD